MCRDVLLQARRQGPDHLLYPPASRYQRELVRERLRCWCRCGCCPEYVRQRALASHCYVRIRCLCVPEQLWKVLRYQRRTLYADPVQDCHKSRRVQAQPAVVSAERCWRQNQLLAPATVARVESSSPAKEEMALERRRQLFATALSEVVELPHLAGGLRRVAKEGIAAELQLLEGELEWAGLPLSSSEWVN